MQLRARRDWENYDSRVDEGNWYEFLSLSYRFKHWDGWINLRRAIMHRNIFEFRWYRNWWYKHSRNSPRNKKPTFPT